MIKADYGISSPERFFVLPKQRVKMLYDTRRAKGRSSDITKQGPGFNVLGKAQCLHPTRMMT